MEGSWNKAHRHNHRTPYSVLTWALSVLLHSELPELLQAPGPSLGFLFTGRERARTGVAPHHTCASAGTGGKGASWTPAGTGGSATVTGEALCLQWFL